jgi:acyl-CoA synthetase (AMP-forming)/AMP-acid ligase II
MSTGAGIPRPGEFGDLPRIRKDGQYWQVPESINRSIPTDTGTREYEKRPASYDAMFIAAVARNPLAEALVCGERRLSYAELDALVEQTACGLVQAGLRAGERIAIMLDNRLEYIVANLATIRAGGIAVPLGTRLGPMDVAHIVSHCTPTYAITASEWKERLPAGSAFRKTWIVGADADETLAANDKSLGSRDPTQPASFQTLMATPSMSVAFPMVDENDTMMIVYTSGTTGKPKGACLTHRNFAHTCLHYLYALGIDTPQRALLVVPGTHIAGFGPVISVTLCSGGTLVLMRDFKAGAVLQTLEREAITYTVMVPAMVKLCQMDPSLGLHDLAQWRYCIYGGAPMPEAAIQRFSAVLPGLEMVNAYGATETCAVCTMMPSELTPLAPASVDIAMKDEAGRVYVLDRLKDMINRGGFKVFSAEVENALLQHLGVSDCAVVGVPDPVLGERTFALVQTRDANTTGEVLRDFLAARIADYKRPDFWQVGTQPVPRNQNGKLQKAQVRELALRTLT